MICANDCSDDSGSITVRISGVARSIYLGLNNISLLLSLQTETDTELVGNNKHVSNHSSIRELRDQSSTDHDLLPELPDTKILSMTYMPAFLPANRPAVQTASQSASHACLPACLPVGQPMSR